MQKSLVNSVLRFRIGYEADRLLRIASSRPKTVTEYWQYVHKRNVYANKFRKLVGLPFPLALDRTDAFLQAWEENKFDMIVCPVQAVPALKHDETEWLSPLW